VSNELRMQLQDIVYNTHCSSPILGNWDEIALPLSCGRRRRVTVCYYVFGFAPTCGIKDVDIVYFDADDLSEGKPITLPAFVRHSLICQPVRCQKIRPGSTLRPNSGT
jgi:hypothetical protein